MTSNRAPKEEASRPTGNGKGKRNGKGRSVLIPLTDQIPPPLSPSEDSGVHTDTAAAATTSVVAAEAAHPPATPAQRPPSQKLTRTTYKHEASSTTSGASSIPRAAGRTTPRTRPEIRHREPSVPFNRYLGSLPRDQQIDELGFVANNYDQQFRVLMDNVRYRTPDGDLEVENWLANQDLNVPEDVIRDENTGQSVIELCYNRYVYIALKL